MSSKSLHTISFAFGLVFLFLSCFQAIFLAYSHFYTSFTIGSWLVLDWVDYRLTGSSILSYFFNHKHRDAFVFFFVVATFFCFVVDYIYGVQVTGMWEWVNYEPVHFVRMYVFMNVSFLLGMYELYRAISAVLTKNQVKSKNLVKLRLSRGWMRGFYLMLLAVGIVLMLSPLYIYVLNTREFLGYIAAMPFIGMLFIVDSLTYLLGGDTVLMRVLRFDKLFILSVLLTVAVGVVVTESLNIYGGEWKYHNIPFQHIQLLQIPIFVILGWFPLVISAIAMVDLVKRFDFVHDNKLAPKPKRKKK